MDLVTVEQRMQAAYDAASLPSWPDPHPDGQSPADDEYSRCLDPGRYRIVGARAEAWATALTDLGLAERTDGPAPRGARRPGRTVLLSPRRPGAMSIRFVLLDFDGAPDALLEIAVGPDAEQVHAAPVCGCDACDDGSDRLLEDLDEQVADIVSGELRVASGDGWRAVSTANSLSVSGRKSVGDARRLLASESATKGPAWF